MIAIVRERETREGTLKNVHAVYIVHLPVRDESLHMQEKIFF